MRSVPHGPDTSRVEVTDITSDGFSLRLGGRDYRVGFDRFRWFRGATPAQIQNVQAYGDELRWPDLDIDLCIDSIEHPERYPLVSRGGDVPV